jgi:lipoprotein-anchoring transpeptidase ErfK/SrfK
MWIHWDYKWSANRKTKLYSSNSIDHRASNGCINVDSDLFGEIYNHLETGWVLYVAYE